MNIYTEILRLNLNAEDTSALFYSFNEDGEAKARAESAFTFFNNDDQKHGYLKLALASCMCLVISRNMFCSFILMKCVNTIVYKKNPELSTKSQTESVNSVTSS